MQKDQSSSAPSTPSAGRIRQRRRSQETPFETSTVNVAHEDSHLPGFWLLNWICVVNSYTEEEYVQVSVWPSGISDSRPFLLNDPGDLTSDRGDRSLKYII
ncbi:hypothetical protein MKW98_010728 [Papaver atlanticum]|uniref:Uncharacterized protein n=1 Tax=Papaver atlanticum TaxID=357466 RepID=A0AAD4SIF5_9MAGN|nr:hypothetical protein MKW98_010728 [Papaver atlanticum]